MLPTDPPERFTCGYCGKEMSWNELQSHSTQQDYDDYKAKHPDFKGAIWLAMILETMGRVDLSTNETMINYMRISK